MKSLLPAFSQACLGVSAMLLFGAHANATTIVFDNNAAFDSNFYKPAAGIGAANLLQTGSTLHFTPTTGATNATAIYNTSTTGGAGGAGGTALGSPITTFDITADGLAIEATYKNDRFDGANGLGIYFGLNNAATSGELLLFRLSPTTTVGPASPDVRFASNANPTATANAGSVGGSNPFNTSITDLSLYYTFRVTLTLNGSNVDIAAQLFDTASGTQLGNTVTSSILASSITTTGGQVGFRIGGVQNSIEDIGSFSVAAVPEPAVMGLILVGLAVTVFRLPRSRKA